MTRRNKKNRLWMSCFGLMCLLLFLGTKEEGCSSCSMIDEKLVTQYGTIKVVNFLDVDNEYATVKIEGDQYFSKAELDEDPTLWGNRDKFVFLWVSSSDPQVAQKKVKSGAYRYCVYGSLLEEHGGGYNLLDAGMVAIPAGEIQTIKIK
jgi:hypothetical protein